MADGCGEEASAQKNQIYEAEYLVEIWADEELEWQLFAMGRQQNVWENMVAKLSDNGYKGYTFCRKRKRKCRLFDKRCISPPSPPKSLKIDTTGQTMNAAVIVISSSILQLKGKTKLWEYQVTV